MKIAIFGLGYVGVVSAACLARDGHEVLGVDPNPVKAELVNQAKSPIVEPGLEELIRTTVGAGQLRAGADHAAAVRHCELTPGMRRHARAGQRQPRPALCAADRASRSARQLASIDEFQIVVDPLHAAAGLDAVGGHSDAASSSRGKRAGEHFGVCINPEFLREGTAIYDYDHPPKTVIGADRRAQRRARARAVREASRPDDR